MKINKYDEPKKKKKKKIELQKHTPNNEHELKRSHAFLLNEPHMFVPIQQDLGHDQAMMQQG